MDSTFFIETFSHDNAAFDDDRFIEVARILRDIADKVEHHHEIDGTIRDINGNGLGYWGFS